MQSAHFSKCDPKVAKGRVFGKEIFDTVLGRLEEMHTRQEVKSTTYELLQRYSHLLRFYIKPLEQNILSLVLLTSQKCIQGLLSLLGLTLK